MISLSADLPIAQALPDLLRVLATGCNAVLQAPPGAGKTTGVPLALLDEAWLGGTKILMLEPRRLAARAAARRMAVLLGETVGETAGYRVRLDSRIGPRTRIEVVTDGIFTRMIQDDPTLDGIGIVLFDEFHERRLDTDLGLALSLDSQAALRPDLRLVAMSATLDAGPVAALMRAETITARGRAYPVEPRHLAQPAPDRLVRELADTVLRALDEPGDILVFLPGGGEIRRVERALAERRLPANIDVRPLFGDLDGAAQDSALAPAPAGRRKIVLATSIAETSLTIEGVRQIVDAGLSRTSRFDPRTGMTRLETQRVSQAAAEQRAGRAGRTAPG
ncbi:MAG: helicase-related protein, partial [Aliidongia sp.]